jgi:exopolysaccharide production protein ExoQ
MYSARTSYVIDSDRSISAKASFADPIRAKISRRVSHWLWVPFVWLFFSSTRSLASWVTGELSGGDASGNPIDRGLMIVLIVLGLYVLRGRAQQTRRILVRNRWTVSLFMIMAASILWSNFPEISLRRCIRSIGAFAMVLVVVTEHSPLDAIRVLLQRLYVLQIPLSFIAIKYFRNIGVVYDWSGSEEQWVGLSTDKNSLGQAAMCAGLFAVWRLLESFPRRHSKRGRQELFVNFGILEIAVLLLRGSKNVHSSTAIVGFVFCALILILLQFVKKRARQAKRLILGVLVSLLLAAPVLFVGFEMLDTSPVALVAASTGRDMTFTDRTLIWTDLWNNAMESPLLGVGIGAFWVGPIGDDIYPLPNWSRKTPEWRPGEGHNGYLDVYVELGIGGVLLLLAIIVRALIDALNQMGTDFQYASLRISFLLSIVLNNITETSFLKGTHGFWFLFLLVATNLPLAIKRRPRSAFEPSKSIERNQRPYVRSRRSSLEVSW